MIILVKDEEGLGTALRMDGYTQDQIIEAQRAVRNCFAETAKFVFTRVLETELPATITVKMAQNDQDELAGNKAAALATFYAERSREGDLLFYIREKVLKGYLTGQGTDLFEATVLHEMLHAADLPEFSRDYGLIHDISREIQEIQAYSFTDLEAYPKIALVSILGMFRHFRAEGVAMLGEHMVKNKRFNLTVQSLWKFYSAFMKALGRSFKWAGGERAVNPEEDRYIYESAYRSAPTILLKVLFRRGDIDEAVYDKVIEGLNTGVYELTEDEKIATMRTALSLSFSEYIQGLLMLDEEVAPMRPLLELCGVIQGDRDDNYIDKFIQLIQSPDTEKTFLDAMRTIIGRIMPQKELDQEYANFQQNPPDLRVYPQLKDKVATLYSTMQTTTDPKKKEIAQWALTYFFDEGDVISDNVPGLGLVDDALVIDNALKLIS